jgi:tetratricopeptide (TPR) repeat protein
MGDGDHRAAADHLARALPQYEHLGDARGVARTRFALGEAEYALGEGDYRQELYDAVARQFSRALVSYESEQVRHLEATPARLADTHFNLAMCHFKAGRYDLARSGFERAASLGKEIGSARIASESDDHLQQIGRLEPTGQGLQGAGTGSPSPGSGAPAGSPSTPGRPPGTAAGPR